MRKLEERILKDGKCLPGGVLKVDTFLNHQIDLALMHSCAEEFARLFADRKVDKVLTIGLGRVRLDCHTDLLRMFIRSRPEEPNPRNKAGTAMNFVRTADPCVLTTYKTYWYGLEHPNDCFFNQYYYDLTLTSDSEAVAKIRKTVGWPDSEAEFVYSAVLSNYDLKVQRISPNYVLLAVSNCFFEITSEIHHTTSQYAEETDKEEMFHEKQIRGLVGKEDGGFPGLFSTGFALSNLLFSCDGENNFSRRIFVLNSENIDDIRVNWAVIVSRALCQEHEYSIMQIDLNRGYVELKAKLDAKYGEAYRYECTYGNPASGCRYCGNAEDLTPWSGR